MAATPEQHATLVNVMRWAGIPVSVEAERSIPMPDEPPLDPDLSAQVEAVAVGMAGADRLTPHELARQIKLVRQHGPVPFSLFKDGHRSIAIAHAGAAVHVIEDLARRGSEDAAGALQIFADAYGAIGIGEEAFALARRLSEKL